MSYESQKQAGRKMYSVGDRAVLLKGQQYIYVDKPAQFVSRITLNRPEKRNAMNHELRGQLFNQLQINDQDDEVRVTIIRGAGKAFCAGYDLDMNRDLPFPMFEAQGDGKFQRNVLAGWFMMMDLAKPIIAQVHGYCLAGGSELASACDIICVSEGAKIGYPPVRSMGLPDTQIFPWVCGMRKAMELMLTGDSMSGEEAFRCGWATKCFKNEDLEENVIELAKRVAKIPADLLAYNKRSVHRAMEAMGMRTHLRAGTDLQALSFHSQSSVEFMKKFSGDQHSAKNAFRSRDNDFNDNGQLEDKQKSKL